MLQKFIIFIVSFSLVFGDVIPRAIDDDLLDTTKITKIPYGFYKERMEKGTYKVVDKENLAAYPLKHIFVGYGIYDIEEQNCKYIENDANKQTFQNDYEKIHVFNNNTFAISRSKMTYAQCVASTEKYVGDIYAPHSLIENEAISRGYFLEDEVWIGLQKATCEDDYLNVSGITQVYENFMYENTPCDEDKLNIYKLPGSTKWSQANRDTYKKCVIRIETNNYLKPIKICAPWWRIESSFVNKNKETLIWGGKEISFDSFLMPDIPQRVKICTEKRVEEGVDEAATKRTTCKKYYSRLAGGGNSGECLEEPLQPACEINECAGYIEDNCEKIEKLEDYKDYTWGYIDKDGTPTRVKIEDKIRTYVYECPAVNPNENDCLKREEILVFPKECPSSHCDALRECIQSNSHTTGYCYDTYTCEKVYGDPEIAPVYESGKIVALKARCSDGSIVENDQIREESYSKVDCVKYEEILETNTTVKKCISENTKELHELDTTITEPDIYANDPNCVRTNNIEDARPYIDIVFDYTNRGFFTTVIQKAYISGEVNDTVDVPLPENQLPYQISNLKAISYDSAVSSVIDDSGIVTSEECSEYFTNDDWYNKRIGILFENSSINPLGILQANDSENTYPIVSVVRASDCENAASALGYKNITDDIEYEDYPFSEIGIDSNEELRDTGSLFDNNCVLGDTNSLSGDDIVHSIQINAAAESVRMSTKSLKVDELQCLKYTTCLGLHMESSYEDNTTLNTCVMNNEDTDEPVELAPDEEKFLDFVESNGTIATTLDGTKDIIVLQEYAPGRFGYMSNYRFQLPKNNIVRMNNKEIFPLIPNAPVEENLTYDYDVYSLKQTCKNREPSTFEAYFKTLSFGAIDSTGNASGENNFGAAAIAGGAVGVSALLVTSPLMATGVGIVVIALVMMFAGNKKYGMIRSHWTVDKQLAANVSFVENPYGYDFREYNSTSRVFTYERTKYQMPMAKKGKFEENLQEYREMKQNALYFAGYTRDQITSPLVTSCERDGCIGYPKKVKWYHFSGKNSASATNVAKVSLKKPVNTIYMGATNTVVVFVPYAGDYEMIALDKNKNILGSKIITTKDFIDTDEYKYPFAKVMFSLSKDFGLANGIEYGKTEKACIYDDFTEWGGGVSGVYYEDGTPGQHQCSKSNDAYVESFSAKYIKFRPVDSNSFFEVELKKPMPFANRFFFVSFGKLETRKYECYTQGKECQP